MYRHGRNQNGVVPGGQRLRSLLRSLHPQLLRLQNGAEPFHVQQAGRPPGEEHPEREALSAQAAHGLQRGGLTNVGTGVDYQRLLLPRQELLHNALGQNLDKRLVRHSAQLLRRQRSSPTLQLAVYGNPQGRHQQRSRRLDHGDTQKFLKYRFKLGETARAAHHIDRLHRVLP